LLTSAFNFSHLFMHEFFHIIIFLINILCQQQRKISSLLLGSNKLEFFYRNCFYSKFDQIHIRWDKKFKLNILSAFFCMSLFLRLNIFGYKVSCRKCKRRVSLNIYGENSFWNTANCVFQCLNYYDIIFYY
jgi:hypothetical protein